MAGMRKAYEFQVPSVVGKPSAVASWFGGADVVSAIYGGKQEVSQIHVFLYEHVVGTMMFGNCLDILDSR